MNNIRIGFIGLGNMGKPMAEQLLQAEYPLTVFNRDQEKQSPLVKLGAKAAENPAEAAAESDFIIIMVSDDRAIKAIFEGENGLSHINLKDKIIINMSTVSPGISKEIAALCQAQGGEYLDAPVSGSVKQAETGQLVIMVGGKHAAFEKTKPILNVMGKLANLVGDTGAGNNAKLAINSLLALYAQGLAETVLFAQEKGIEPAALLELIGNAAIGNTFTKIKGDAILADNYKAAFALKHIVKDLKLAQAEGISTPLVSAALKTFESAEKQYGEEDIIAILKALDIK
ncbi:NAD(P)-dependent oxidoreductase [Pedobacter sandarakinus]|uniref:NAD(P)-dependent oxidoreductase n=1 Tax=Pedobacter sandarakinus TaxID=353156 RepID=UPI002246D238|nr:NAD(P)-dependent oxidoreductase [Pedobacter sandarakinus]MCX2575860.1 NAD(P)-dependent oxidoreductase [Pedobacter sandarakinus]